MKCTAGSVIATAIASVLTTGRGHSLAAPLVSGEVGYDGAVPWDTGSRSPGTPGVGILSRPYAKVGITAEPHSPLTATPERLRLAGLAREELQDPGAPKVGVRAVDARITAAMASWRGNLWQLTLGKQEIVWGETFGVAIADVLQPRDLRESIFATAADARLASTSAALLLHHRHAHLQLVAIPWPTRPRLPPRIGGVPLRDGSTDTTAPEAGLRLGYLFDSGVDVKLLAARHQSRLPSYTVDASSPATPELVYQSHPVTSAGLGVTYAMESLVIRGDAMQTWQQPASQGVPNTRDEDVLQTIFGSDYSFASGLVLGVQHHLERFAHKRPGIRGSATSQWLSVQVREAFWRGRLEAQLLAMRGLGNADLWLEPEVKLAPSDDFELTLALDRVDGAAGEPGYFGPYRQDSRLWCRGRYLF